MSELHGARIRATAGWAGLLAMLAVGGCVGGKGDRITDTGAGASRRHAVADMSHQVDEAWGRARMSAKPVTASAGEAGPKVDAPTSGRSVAERPTPTFRTADAPHTRADGEPEGDVDLASAPEDVVFAVAGGEETAEPSDELVRIGLEERRSAVAPAAAEEEAVVDAVARVQLPAPSDGDSPVDADAVADAADEPRPDTEPLPEPVEQPADRHPVNLVTVLQLAGANNLQIRMATERVRQAIARLNAAEVLWIPSLNLGVGYNAHGGQIQDTRGEVIETNRESVFVGGGAGLDGAPLNGPSGGPPRLFVALSPVDAYYEPLGARQGTRSARAAETGAFNDTLLEVTVAYLELLRAQSQLAVVDEAIEYAEQLVSLTSELADAGAGLEADVLRAEAFLADRRIARAVVEEELQVTSAELARLLRLPSTVTLFAVDGQPVPLALVDESAPLDALVGQGLASRPELAVSQAEVAETMARVRQERLRPWVPNLFLGMTSGGFGGGGNGSFTNFSDRTDFDALAVWELRNLGLGNRALVQARESEHRQAHLALQQARDQVVADVAQAYHRVRLRSRQIEHARTRVRAAARALPLNFRGIRGRELRAIEAQQAISALLEARSRYLAAIVGYDQAQFQLLRAVGQPSAPGGSTLPAVPADEATPEEEQLPAPPVPAAEENRPVE